MSEVEYTKLKEGENLLPPPYSGGYPTQGSSPYPPADNQQPNEVIIGQPGPAPPVKEVVYSSPPAKDFLIFTAVTMIVFGIFGGVIGACITIPALICSLMARSKNDSGNTQEARNYGLLALCWNIGVIVYHIILWMGIIIAIIVVFARGEASTSAGNSGSESTCTYVLTQVCYTYSCGYKYVYKCS